MNENKKKIILLTRCSPFRHFKGEYIDVFSNYYEHTHKKVAQVHTEFFSYTFFEQQGNMIPYALR